MADAQTPSLMSPLIGLGGVVLGFLLSQAKDWWQRRLRRKTHWRAVKAEIEYIGGVAAGFIEAGVKSPLYRLPTTCYQAGFPIFLSDSDITDTEVDALLRFYAEVETFNRGLDSADEALGTDRLEREVKRNMRKAQRLTKEHGALYDQAFAVTQRHLK